MLRRVLSLLLGGASGACGFAALGVALYAQGQASAAAGLFGAVGFVTGAVCAALPWRRGPAPAPRPQAVSAEALASMLRATLASAASERAARPGSAADRRPAQVAADALAQAAAPSAPPAAQPVAAATAAGQPAARRAPVAGQGRQFASSAFGG
jgi:hypothetical protein